ncbi:MAG: DNA polymerase III subunit chi [Gammaproteobacteria bacterium]|nr:DNA polymerase III subunit chi [Gammaproteobacteria bacterium]
MSRVDFYILEAEGDEARGHTACRLAERAWKAGNRVFLRADSARAVTWLDELLWTFRQDSFVPHACAQPTTRDNSSESDTLEPVLIGLEEATQPPADVLINLGEDVPLRVADYARVAEIITADEGIRQQGRERFRFYRDRGCEVHTHNL